MIAVVEVRAGTRVKNLDVRVRVSDRRTDSGGMKLEDSCLYWSLYAGSAAVTWMNLPKVDMSEGEKIRMATLFLCFDWVQLARIP